LCDNVNINRTWEYRTGNVKKSARQTTLLQIKPNEPQLHEQCLKLFKDGKL